MSTRSRLAILVLACAGVIAFAVWSMAHRNAASATLRDAPTNLVDAGARSLDEIAALPDESLAARGASQRANAPTSLTGRVVNAEDGLGLPGFWARAWSERELTGEASSDGTGYFQLPAPRIDAAGKCDGRVRLQAPWGWTLLAHELDVRPRADGGFDELLFRARPARFGKLRAKLVDIDTSEPVPHYMLRIGTADGSREQVVSDARAHFTSEREYPESVLQLYFHDFETSTQGANEERLCYSTEFAHDPLVAEPPTIAIPVGPTFPLQLDAPPPALQQILFASLSPPRADTSLRVMRGESQVRGDSERWVRFRPHYRHVPSSSERWMLNVASADGLWFGAAPVDSLRGIHPSPVVLRLEARSQLLGRLRDRDGAPIGQANVGLVSLANGVEASTLSSGNGLFAFELVPAGRYVVTAISTQHAITSSDVLVRAGERAEVELVLERAVIAGAVAGQLIATEAPDRNAPSVILISSNPAGRWIEQPTRWQHDGERWTAEFRVEDVPAGDYEVVLSNLDRRRWSPETMRITAPAEGLRFVLASTSICVAFEAADAGDGHPLAICKAVVLSRGCRDESDTFERAWNDCIHHAGELDGDARWIVAADGYAPYWGARAELSSSENGLVGRASLQRGWGLELVALGPGFTTLAGAEARLDDELGGATDRDGVLRIVRGRRPERIDVRYRDWRVDSSSRTSLRRAIEAGDPRCVVFLAPP